MTTARPKNWTLLDDNELEALATRVGLGPGLPGRLKGFDLRLFLDAAVPAELVKIRDTLQDPARVFAAMSRGEIATPPAGDAKLAGANSAGAAGPAVWLTADGAAYGRVSDEQVEAALVTALAGVRRRNGWPHAGESQPRHHGEAAAATVPDTLHGQIMNLRCAPPASVDSQPAVMAYKLGHRDARHGAAELAAAAAAQPSTRNEVHLDDLDDRGIAQALRHLLRREPAPDEVLKVMHAALPPTQVVRGHTPGVRQAQAEEAASRPVLAVHELLTDSDIGHEWDRYTYGFDPTHDLGREFARRILDLVAARQADAVHELERLIHEYGRACRRDGNPAWPSPEGRALRTFLRGEAYPSSNENPEPAATAAAPQRKVRP